MLKKILIFLITFCTIILGIINVCYANTEETVNITSLEIKSPESGIYGVGQKITIRMSFDKPIKGNMPQINFNFGRDAEKTITIPEITEAVSYVDYTYEIALGDNGEFKISTIQLGYVFDNEGKMCRLNLENIQLTGNTIMADTTINRTDVSNADFEWDNENPTDHNNVNLVIKNMNFIENNSYYIHLSNDKNEKINMIKSDSIYEGSVSWKLILNNKISGAEIDKVLEENGEIYIWICEIDNTYKVPKIIIEAQKVERLQQLPVGSKLNAFFFKDETTTFCWEPHSDDERKINVKIGRVLDINILKSIKNGEANCLQNLLTYAKSSDSIYTGIVSLGKSEGITNEINLIDEAYYYVYMELEDENGKYYPVEDVSLYQAIISEDGDVRMLCDYLDDQFKWNLEENPEDNPLGNEPTDDTTLGNGPTDNKPKDPTTSNTVLPNTGNYMYILIILIIILAIVGFITYKKKNF